VVGSTITKPAGEKRGWVRGPQEIAADAQREMPAGETEATPQLALTPVQLVARSMRYRYRGATLSWEQSINPVEPCKACDGTM
jgi:hypothetical protein